MSPAAVSAVISAPTSLPTFLYDESDLEAVLACYMSFNRFVAQYFAFCHRANADSVVTICFNSFSEEQRLELAR